MGRPRPPGARPGRTNAAAENHQATETPARLIPRPPARERRKPHKTTSRTLEAEVPPCGLAADPRRRLEADRTQNYFFLAPRTESLSDFAAVNRNLVRAGILMASPVAGLRPMRALDWRLRKIPSPARRRDPSFLSSRTTRLVNSSSALFACFLVIPTLSARWAATCDCVIILLLMKARLRGHGVSVTN